MTKNHSRFRAAALALATSLALGGTALAAGHKLPDDVRNQIKAAETAAFSEADANGDGKLTPEEFANFHELMRQKIDAIHFARLDTNGDGALTRDEIDAGHAAHHHHRGPGF
jgi:hypothetical protein